jgi:hypothetical protein
MRTKKKALIFTLFFAICLFATVNQVNAETKTFTVLPCQQEIISLNLNAGDSASGSIVVNGEKAVDFWVSDPHNDNVTLYPNVGHADFSFTAETTGTFLIHLFNRATDSSVTVTINYNAVHRIFGMPQEMFLLIVIVGIVLLLLAVWAILSKA